MLSLPGYRSYRRNVTLGIKEDYTDGGGDEEIFASAINEFQQGFRGTNFYFSVIPPPAPVGDPDNFGERSPAVSPQLQ